MNPLLMVWNLQEVVVKQFAHFYIEILMVLESSRSCREAMIDGLDSPGGCCENIYILFKLNIDVLKFMGSRWEVSGKPLWSHLQHFSK